MKIGKPEDWKYPDDWPPEEFSVNHADISRDQLDIFKSIIDKNASETEVESFLIGNKSLLVNILREFKTGHNSAWVIPKQMVRPPATASQKGLIPDHILGGLSSDGFSWFVLELKGANEKIFKESKNNKLYFGSVANRAICQSIEYIDYCASAQSYLRDTLKLKDFREPKGLILMGREFEFSKNSRRKNFKSAWNRLMGQKIEIRTYDSLIRWVSSVVEYNEKSKS